MNSDNSGLSIPAAILIGSIIISISILVSGGAIKIKGFSPNTAALPTAQEAVVPEEEDLGPVQVSVDDDPVLGDQSAPVTVVEFSDYECPFCKRYFTDTFPNLKKDYIDTGKVKLVFRDFPLSFHDPMATTEAIAANCAREQGGDTAYFRLHDTIFEETASNGNGLTKDDLYKFAADQGLNAANFKSCVDSEKNKAEITKDLEDGQTVGVTGTPSFVIGKSSANGTIEGEVLVGAQPYNAFKTIIDQKLAE